MQALFLSPIIRFFFKKNVLLLALKPNQGLDYINELFEDGQIKPVTEAPYKLSEVPEAIQHFGAGNHQGKVIVTLENEL